MNRTVFILGYFVRSVLGTYGNLPFLVCDLFCIFLYGYLLFVLGVFLFVCINMYRLKKLKKKKKIIYYIFYKINIFSANVNICSITVLFSVNYLKQPEICALFFEISSINEYFPCIKMYYEYIVSFSQLFLECSPPHLLPHLS